MQNKHMTTKNVPKEIDNSRGTEGTWVNWCRLCAKMELNKQESSSIFDKNATGKSAPELATSVGKYFWVNIKEEDEISQCLCLECKKLLDELVTFTEHVNKVQTLYCLLQNIKPCTAAEANKYRQQFGLDDEGWKHLIKQETPKLPEPLPKPLLIDQQVQTDEITPKQNNLGKDTQAILNVLCKEQKNDEYESQTETETDQVYEYIMQDENEISYVESGEYIVPINKVETEDVGVRVNTSSQGEEMTVEVQDSDLFKELKFKIEDDDEEGDTQQQNKKIKIVTQEEEIELEYQDSQQPLQPQNEDEEFVESMEILEEDEDDYVSTSDMQVKSLPLLKSKRGRPFGSKKETDANAYRFECKECKRCYKSSNLFRKHMLTVHEVYVDLSEFPELSNICTECNKQFATQSSLKFHMKLHLPDEEKFTVPCPYCERKFSQVGAMKQHVNGIHHQMKPFICDQCGRACKTMAALNEHQLVHTTECPFECEVCFKRFKNKPRLKSHMDVHNKLLYKCPDCGLELNTKRTLLQHRLVHSDEKRFKCEFCDTAFKRSKALKNHLILHSGLRPYICNFCKKSFSNGSNCRAHKKRTHPKELAEQEANGEVAERVPIPKLEELKSAKGILVQPRKIRRSGGISANYRKLAQNSDKRKQQITEFNEDHDMPAENYETYSDFQYEISKSEVDETESLADTPGEQREETIIYEIIDEI